MPSGLVGCDQRAAGTTEHVEHDIAALRTVPDRIIGILKEQESGSPTAEVCRKHGISSATFYKYKARFGGLDVSEAQRLKALEDEHGKLK